jgi:hypothetical protein
MQSRKLIIDGSHYTVNCFKESDGSVRVEVSHDITGKHYKMFPDNKINLNNG